MNRIVRMLALAAFTMVGLQAGAATPAEGAKDSAPAVQAASGRADAQKCACQPSPAKPLSPAQQKVMKDWESLQAMHANLP
jgi:hypothetical protein